MELHPDCFVGIGCSIRAGTPHSNSYRIFFPLHPDRVTLNPASSMPSPHCKFWRSRYCSFFPSMVLQKVCSVASSPSSARAQVYL